MSGWPPRLDLTMSLAASSIFSSLSFARASPMSPRAMIAAVRSGFFALSFSAISRSLSTAAVALRWPSAMIAHLAALPSASSSAFMTAGIAFWSPMRPRACIARRRRNGHFEVDAVFTSASTAPFACIQPREIMACTRTFSSSSSIAFTRASTAALSSGEMRPSSSAAS